MRDQIWRDRGDHDWGGGGLKGKGRGRIVNRVMDEDEGTEEYERVRMMTVTNCKL